MFNISKLHFITQGNVPGYTHAQLAEEACKGGVSWVQLRVKGENQATWKQIALETLHVCRKYGAKLIINDNPHLVKEIGAEGVHLGKKDMDPIEARRILGKDYIIGGTANDFEDLLRLQEAKVDYIGLGPFRFTATKDKLSPVLGKEGFLNIMDLCRENKIQTPVIAIGGILPTDISDILHTGIYGIAVASAINLAEDNAAKAAEYLQIIENHKKALI